MRSLQYLLVLAAHFLLWTHPACGHPTDTVQDCDDFNSGYLPNHNIDPGVVGSPNFGINWRVSPNKGRVNGVETFMAKPLVYTPRTRFQDGKPVGGGKQLVIAVSESNWVYVLDAVSGGILQSRQIRKPYLSSELPCGDITPVLGVTGTPVVDSKTDTLYLFAKGYAGNATGPFNAGYFLHALDVLTLQERPGFPTAVGGPADNDPGRYFNGGLYLQRPSLKIVNDIVFGGFGGGCGDYNQTGWITGINSKSGALTTLWASDTGAEAPQAGDGFRAGGGGGSVWGAGVGFSSDRPDRFFFTTGNGFAFNSTTPSSGKTPNSLMEGCIVNMKVDSSGKASPQDYFRPADYISYGPSSRDIGSAGLTLLNPNYFSGKGVKRLAIGGGKNGLLYLLNADNLGGYKQGANGTDAVLQTIAVPAATATGIRGRIYGGVGSYPLEGGYIYVKPVDLRTVLVYKFSTKDGVPSFSKVAQTNETIVTSIGAGTPVITSYQGRAGTGIVWIVDLNLALTAYKAVPENSQLVRINIPPLNGRAKFQRPVFGNGRLYVATTDGEIVCYGNLKDKPPQVVPSTAGFNSQGCFTESTSGRALSGKFTHNTTMTVDLCAQTCKSFAYFGVEYGQECYCGDALAPGATPAPEMASCDVPCSGNSTTLCGGRRYLNLYKRI